MCSELQAQAAQRIARRRSAPQVVVDGLGNRLVALGAATVLQSMLYGVSVFDPVAYLTAAGGLMIGNNAATISRTVLVISWITGVHPFR